MALHYFRGEDFRNAYSHMSELRALLPHVPVLVCTATITKSILDKINVCLGTEDSETVATIPDRFVF